MWNSECSDSQVTSVQDTSKGCYSKIMIRQAKIDITFISATDGEAVTVPNNDKYYNIYLINVTF
jgi:hypothetical protein